MKLFINGDVTEGTPEELSKYKKLVESDVEENYFYIAHGNNQGIVVKKANLYKLSYVDTIGNVYILRDEDIKTISNSDVERVFSDSVEKDALLIYYLNFNTFEKIYF